MNRSNRTTLALLSAITIGLINIASLSVIYVMFHDARKPAESALAQGTTGSPSGSTGTDITGSSPADVGQVGTTGSGSSGNTASGGSSSTSTATNGQPSQPGTSSGSGSSTASGGGSTKSSGGGTQKSGSSSGSGSGSGSSSGGGGSSTPPAPNSLAKGPPCTTQVPPAGVCKAVLSFNNQKDGNPYWDPALLASIKQGIASDSFVQLLGLNPTTIYNQMTVTIKENTWSGNATHGTIQGTMNAQGQSQATTFTLDWRTDKWVVDDIVQN